MFLLELRQFWEESLFFRCCIGIVVVGIAVMATSGLSGVSGPTSTAQAPSDEVLDRLLSDQKLRPTPEQIQLVEAQITTLSPSERQRYNQRIIQWRNRIVSLPTTP